MARRKTDLQRVTEFFMLAPIDEARQAVEVARTIVESRLPALRPTRKPRAPKETEAA